MSNITMLHIDNNPWLGLYSYQQSDAASFFGRDREVQFLYNNINANYCTFIYGKSGIGKTSLINAGLLPKLANEGFLPISIKFEHDTDCSYVDQIITKITDALHENQCDIEQLATMSDLLSDSAKLWLFVHGNVFWTSKNRPIIPVVFIDQFEEIFTLSDNAARTKEFFLTLNELFHSLPPKEIVDILEKEDLRIRFREQTNFRIVFSMREDFLARLEDYSYYIPVLRKNRVGIAPMTGNQALEVILKPYPGIIDRETALKVIASIIDDENVSDNPEYLDTIKIDTCILSLFCSQLYKKAVENKLDKITQDLIKQSGFDIIHEYYKESVRGISSTAINYLEDKLLTNSGYRNSLAYEDVVPEYASVKEIKQLEQARIIRKEVVNKIERIEFSHDVLCGIAKMYKDYNKKLREREDEKKNHFKQLLWLYGGELMPLSLYILGLAMHPSNINDHWATCLLGTIIMPILMILTCPLRLSPVINNYKSKAYIYLVVGLSWLLLIGGMQFLSPIFGLVWGMYFMLYSCLCYFYVSTLVDREISFNEALKIAYSSDTWKTTKISDQMSIFRGVILVSFLIAGISMLRECQIVALILLIPSLIFVWRPKALKNRKVLLWSVLGTSILLLWYISQYIDPILYIGQLVLKRNIILFYIPILLLAFVVRKIIKEINSEETPNSYNRYVYPILGVGTLICLFSVICGYNVLTSVFLLNVSVEKVGFVDGKGNKRYLVVEDIEHNKMVLDRWGDLIYPEMFDQVSEHATIVDGHLQIEADGKIVSTADYREYRNLYTKDIVDEDYEQLGSGVLSRMNNVIGRNRYHIGDTVVANKIEQFCRSDDAMLLLTPQYYLQFAKHYSHDKDKVYESFIQALQLQLAINATDKVLGEVSSDSTMLSKQILLNTIVYLKTGYLCDEFKEFYHSHLEDQTDYLNYIKKIVVDVKVKDFGEQIIDKGIVDKELLQELSSDKYQNIIKQRKIAKHIKLLKNRTNS